jgi:hypothetical protein
LEDKRLGSRGTVVVGALAIIAIFMIAVTCFAALIAEYNRYVYAVRAAGEKLLLRGKERLTVEQISNREIRVSNAAAATSFVVGVFALNPTDNNVKYVELDAPASVKVLSTEEISLPEAIPTGWKAAVLTAYGNIFWEEE